MSRDQRLTLIVTVCVSLYLAGQYLLLFPVQFQFFKYPQAAEQFLAGTFPGERLLDLSPLYFYLHLLARRLAPGGWQALVWLQIAAAGASGGLLFLLLRRLVPLWLALAGAAAFALSRSVAFYSCLLEPELLLLFCLLVLLWQIEREGAVHLIAAGIALALAVLLRPNLLPLLLVAPFFFRLRLGRRGWWRPTAQFAAPVVLALLLLSGRNATITGVFSPTVMNPGYVFFEGNNPLSTGQSAVYPPLVGELKNELPGDPDNPHQTYRLLARREAGRELSVRDVNALWAGRAFAYIADHPGRWLRLLGTKACFLLHDFRRHDLLGAYAFDRALRQRWVPTVPFALVSVLALLGIATGLREWRRYLLFYALLAIQGGVMLAMYVSDRQRLALLPVFLVFACTGAGWLLARPRRRLLWGLAVVAATVPLLLPCDLMRDDQHLWEGYQRSDERWVAAVRARDGKDLAAASRHAAASFAAAPWLEDYSRPAYLPFGPGGFAPLALRQLPPVEGETAAQRFDLAQLLLAAGEEPAAEHLLRRLVAEGDRFDRGYLQSSQPALFLARIAARRGDTAEAQRLLETALARAPGDPFVLAELGALTGDPVYGERIERYFGRIDAAFLLGRALLGLGRAGEAAERLTYVATALPELRRARIYLAAALAASGQRERGAAVYLQATSGRVDPVLLEGEILALFGARAEERPADGGIRHEHAVVLAQYGHLAEALAEARAAQSIAPSPQIQATIAQMEALLSGR
jgi:tetratricopeptide (TPR) repeat protein